MFCPTELCHGDICFVKCFVSQGNVHFCFARHTIAQVFLVFFLLGFAVVVGRTYVL